MVSPDSESEGAIVEELSSVGKQVDVEELFNARFGLSEGTHRLLENRLVELSVIIDSRTFP